MILPTEWTPEERLQVIQMLANTNMLHLYRGNPKKPIEYIWLIHNITYLPPELININKAAIEEALL